MGHLYHGYVSHNQRVDEENLNGIYHGDISYYHISSLDIPVYQIVDH